MLQCYEVQLDVGMLGETRATQCDICLCKSVAVNPICHAFWGGHLVPLQFSSLQPHCNHAVTDPKIVLQEEFELTPNFQPSISTNNGAQAKNLKAQHLLIVAMFSGSLVSIVRSRESIESCATLNLFN